MAPANSVQRAFLGALTVLFWGTMLLCATPSVAASPAPATPGGGADEPVQAAYLLDQNSGAQAAYSLRRLSGSYSGPVLRVRRSSDNAEQNIGFSGDDLNIAALETFVGSGDGYVTKWYSQLPGGPALEQSNTSWQPKIAQNGSVLVDSQGLPHIRFDGNPNTNSKNILLASGLPAPLSNHNMTLFVVGEMDYSTKEKVIFAQGVTASYYRLHFKIRENYSFLRVGDGTTSTSFSGLGPVQSARSAWIVDLNGGNIRLFHNNTLADNVSHTKSLSTDNSFYVGGYDDKWVPMNGFLSEVVVFPKRTDAQRGSIYGNINGYWSVGATAPNANTLLPQDWPYQVDLYDWLETVSLGDVSLTPAPLRWDGTYSNVDELANLWLDFGSSTGYTYLAPRRATLGDAKWFVLDNGAGAGIEGSGVVKLYYKENASAVSLANEPAYWYQRHVPMAGGGEGNPYYQNPVVGRRALIIAAVDMMMVDEKNDNSPGTQRNDFTGAALLSWAYTYYHCQGLLNSRTRAAFETGFERFLDKTILWGAKDINSNMDTRSIAAAAYIYNATTNAALKDKAVRAVKRVLFGYEDGVLETRHSTRIGIYFPAGYVGEADSPETTYNGVSLYHILDAYTTTLGQADWAFLGEVVRRMVDFKMHQYFNDPSNGRGGSHVDGPAGYASRTADSYVSDQRGRLWRNVVAAALFDEGRPMAHGTTTVSNMITGITDGVSWLNNQGFSTLDTSTPPDWRGGEPWPMDHPYRPPAGWYTALRNLVDSNHPSTSTPFARSGQNINKSFDDTFWAYKANDGTQDFGFFVESIREDVNYAGWFGGKLETFWTEKAGMLILNRHDKAGNQVGQNENTRVYGQIDTWAVDHVWGMDDSGTPSAFSTATMEHDYNVTYNIHGSSPHIQTIALFKGNTGTEITGVVSVRKTFTALSDGIQVDINVTSDQSDRARQLWATIPVFLRETNNQRTMQDTRIEYWDGGSWRALGTNLVTTGKIRLGRDFLEGQGLQYGYIHFPTVQSVKLAADVWVQSYQASAQGGVRMRNIHIDLLKSGGSIVPMPAQASVTYRVRTKDGAAPPSPPPPPPTNQPPTVALTSPSNGATFPVSPNITIQATAGDSDGNIAKVEFFRGGTKLGEDTSAPYQYVWNNVSTGNYALTAKATDNQGGATTSGVVNITVESSAPPPTNQPPTVALTSPSNGATFPVSPDITIQATAGDSDGNIAKVEFFRGGTKLGEDTSAPYRYTWNNVPDGTYTLTTRATDNQGATSTSNSAQVTVQSAASPAYANDFATYFGNGGANNRSVSIDGNGNIYVVGGTSSTNWPTTPGAYQRQHTNDGWPDAFAAKFDPNGNLIWSTLIGGNGEDYAYVSSVNDQGELYLAGRAGSGFPTTPGAFDRSFNGGLGNGTIHDKTDAFAVKLSAQGDRLLYSTFIGGNGDDNARAIHLLPNGEVILGSGNSTSNNLPVTPGAYKPQRGGNKDAWVGKLSADGSQLRFLTYFGPNNDTNGDETIRSLGADRQGNVWIGGTTSGDDIATTPDAFQRTHGGGPSEAYVAKLSWDGRSLVYFSWLGGRGFDEIETEGVSDAEGNFYVAGATASSDFPVTASAFQRVLKGGGGTFDGDAWVAKINEDGSLGFATYFGGTTKGNEGFFGPAVDGQGNVYAVGRFFSSDVAVTSDAYQGQKSGGTNQQDAALAVFSGDGSALLYGTYFGGGGLDHGRHVAVHPGGDFVVIIGETNSTNLPLHNAPQSNPSGAFLAKFTINGTGGPAPTPNVPPAVALTSPVHGAVFTAPASIALAANASDSDGTVSKVEFFNGSTRLSTDTSAPYTYTWNNVAAGTYALTAKATDDDGATTVTSSASITVQQAPLPPTGTQHVVGLIAGWNLVSTYTDPQDPGMNAVFAGIMGNLVEVRDEHGGVYRPGGTNTIGSWNPRESYMVNVQSAVSLTFEGALLNPGSTPISLDAGWNLVPYLRNTSMPVDQAVASIASRLVMVKDEHGRIYDPAFGINTIGNLQPGQGYKINVSQGTTLTYPGNGNMPRSLEAGASETLPVRPARSAAPGRSNERQ